MKYNMMLISAVILAPYALGACQFVRSRWQSLKDAVTALHEGGSEDP